MDKDKAVVASGITDGSYCLREVPSGSSVRSDDLRGNNAAGGVIDTERVDLNGQQTQRQGTETFHEFYKSISRVWYGELCNILVKVSGDGLIDLLEMREMLSSANSGPDMVEVKGKMRP